MEGAVAAPLSAPSLLSPPRAALSAPELCPGEPRRRSPRKAHPRTSSSRRRPRSAAAAALPRRPHGGLPQARPADAAGAEGRGQPAPYHLHQGHDRCRLRVSEGGERTATQPWPHAGAAPPHPGASSGLAVVLRGAVPGSRCPETLRCPGDRAPGAAGGESSRCRGPGSRPRRGDAAGPAVPPAGALGRRALGWGAGRADPGAATALMDAEVARVEMAAGGSAGRARPGRATSLGGAGGCCDCEKGREC